MKETSNSMENEWNGQTNLCHFFQSLSKEILSICSTIKIFFLGVSIFFKKSLSLLLVLLLLRRSLLSSNKFWIVNVSIFINVVTLQDRIDERVQFLIGENFLFNMRNLLTLLLLMLISLCYFITNYQSGKECTFT